MTWAITRCTIDYDQPANVLSGRAVIQATATQNLRRFNLDLRDFYAVSSVTVNGSPANIARPGQQELAISPTPRLNAGSAFTVEVVYSGKPKAIKDPDKSIEGWVPTDDGAYVVNEPQGSPGWYPVNDTPRDKATFDFTISVPAGKEAVANGILQGSPITAGGKTTWHWIQDQPMAPYLATATNGEFLTRQYSAGGVSIFDAVDPNTRRLTTDPPNPTLAFERLDILSRKSSRSFPASTVRIRSLKWRRHRRLGSQRRLRPRDAEPAQLPADPQCVDGGRTRSRTNGSATRSASRSGQTCG